MSSHRLEAGFEHLREAFAEVIREVVEFPRGMLVTILDTKLTANTAHARITLSVFPETMKDEAVRILRGAEQDIKEELVTRIRLRRMPRIHYAFDDTEAEAAEIEQALNELERKGEL
ncbi:ribosome-binding factor A [Candidatus Uhrbacteria bacterium]|nr:MAG: ribosome-binding factor A [Candidatus Uhrbacteria bacterium]